MKRHGILSAIVIFTVLFTGAAIAAPPGHDLIPDEALHQVGVNARVGSVGWRSPISQSGSERNFLEYVPAEIGLNPAEGTIIVEVVRDEAFNREALFSLLGANYDRLFVFRILWEGEAANGGWPYIGFFRRTSRENYWLPSQAEPYYPKFYEYAIPLPRKVARGETATFAVTWGGGHPSRIYFDGRPLPTHFKEGPETFGQDMAAAARFLVGAETSTRMPGGAFSMTTSLVKSFKVINRSLTEAEVAGLDGSTIRSVAHDAFGQAGYSGKLVAGESVNVTLTADPGGAASFEILQPGSRTAGTADRVEVPAVAMTEAPERPGTYRGSYTVRFGDEAAGGRVVGRFVNVFGIESAPLAAERPIEIDGRVHIQVAASNDLVAADRGSRSGLTIIATDANGKAVRDHKVRVTPSTTDEYTGVVGGGSFEDTVGGSLEVDWRGVTDSFGEVTAQYVSGFAAKTILISAKDMVSGDVGVGWVRSYIDGTVDIVVKRPEAAALAFAGTMEVTASRTWLTADGRSRSRITAVVKDEAGNPMTGHQVEFVLAGDNGSIKAVQSRTDSRGRAFADYVAGKVMGQVTIEVRDVTGGLSATIGIELRPDAPAEIRLAAQPAELVVGGEGATVTATVKDVNGNPNSEVDVVYDIAAGEGTLGAASVATGKDGRASVVFTPGSVPGVVTVKGTVTSRAPTATETSAAAGAVFLYGLAEDPGPLTVVGWKVAAGDEVVRGQELAVLADRDGATYIVKSLRNGKVSVFAAEEGDEVEYGDTLAYVLVVEK